MLGQLTSMWANVRISQDDPGGIIVDLGEKGVFSDLSVDSQRPQCLILL